MSSSTDTKQTLITDQFVKPHISKDFPTVLTLLLDRVSICVNDQNKQRNNDKGKEMSRERKTRTALGERHLLDRKEHNCLELIQKIQAVMKELAKLNKDIALLGLEAFGNNKGELHEGGEFVMRYGIAYVSLVSLVNDV